MYLEMLLFCDFMMFLGSGFVSVFFVNFFCGSEEVVGFVKRGEKN